MKKLLLLVAASLVVLVIGFVLYGYFRPIPVLKDVKVYRHIIQNPLGGNYYLYYGGQKIGYLSYVDTWYVDDTRVYGSLSEDNGIEDIIYGFYIDICNKEVYVTPYRMDFEEFLDQRDIPQDKRNFMSGNNVISPNRHDYNREISCGKSK